MPSSTHTVESTSKQNADAAAIKDRTSLEGSLLCRVWGSGLGLVR